LLPAVELRSGLVTRIEPAAGDGAEPAFHATLVDGGAVTARRVLLAGGMRYAVPDTPGLAEQWGGAAFACPYCHGWEHRDRRIGILGATAAAHRVALLRSWSDDLVVLADGELAPEDRDALRAAGVPTTEQPVAAVAPGSSASPTATSSRSMRSTCWRRWRRATTSPPSSASRRPSCPTARESPSPTRSARRPSRTLFAAGDAAGAGNVAAAIAGGSLAGTGLHRALVSEQVR